MRGGATLLNIRAPHSSPLGAAERCADGESRRGQPPGSWWAGERREQPVLFPEASPEMSALNQPCSPPRVSPLLLPSPALGWGPWQGVGLPGGHRPAGG